MPIIGASEIRKSLGTVDRGKAIIRSRRLSAGILEVFEQARMSDLRRSEVKKRLEKVYSENLEIQRKFIDRVGPKSFKRVKFLETISDQYKAFAELVREGNLKGFEQALEASEHSEFLKNRITRARGKAGYTLLRPKIRPGKGCFMLRFWTCFQILTTTLQPCIREREVIPQQGGRIPLVALPLPLKWPSAAMLRRR